MSEDIILPSIKRYVTERVLPFFTVTCNYSDIYLVCWLKTQYIHTIQKNLRQCSYINKPLCVSFEVAFSKDVSTIQRKVQVLSANGILLDAHIAMLQNQ